MYFKCRVMKRDRERERTERARKDRRERREREKREERERALPPTDSLPKWLQKPGLGQAKASIQELYPGLLRGR